MKKLKLIYKWSLLLTTTILFCNASSTAQGAKFKWVKNLRGDDLSFSTQTYMAVSSSENIYNTGYFYNPTDFNPEEETYYLNPIGEIDLFISKLDVSGNFVWAKNIGALNKTVYGTSIAVDSFENVFITGTFKGTVDFDPGIETNFLTSNSNSDIFILKLDSFGNFLWAKSIGGNGFENSFSIKIDQNSDVYAIGSFAGNVDFDPSASIFNLNSPAISSLFVLKLNTEGSFIFAKKIGRNYPDNGTFNTFSRYNIAIDEFNNIYTSGIFSGTIDFDPGIDEYSFTAYTGTFISKLDSLGNFLWVKVITQDDSFSEYVTFDDFSLDNSNNICITGFFQGTEDFDPSDEVFNLTCPFSSKNAFVLKLDVDGNFVWAKQISASESKGNGISTDVLGNIYVNGYFNGEADLDPNEAINNLTSNGENDIFILKLNEDGNFIWSKQIGATNNDEGNSIVVDGFGNIYTNGIFQGVVDFKPGDGGAYLIGYLYPHSYVHKMKPCLSSSYEQTLTICSNESLTIGNNIHNTSGIYNDVLTSIDGCDSIVKTNLTVITSFTNTQSFSICEGDSIVIGSNSYDTTGTYTDVYTSENGCDSTIITNLNVTPINTSQNILLCSGESFVIGSNTYNTSGTYSDSFINSLGCDSTVITNLTINEPINVQITIDGFDVIATQSGAIYQWLNCDNSNLPITGETNQTYSVETTGNYSVVVTVANCADTSVCEYVSVIGIKENQNSNIIKIYPNPSKGIFYIDLKNKSEITITNILGEVILNKAVLAGKQTLTLQNQPNGIYFVKIVSEGEQQIVKLIKEN